MIDWTKAKHDDRPHKGGWAPGGYTCKCLNCGSPYIGDKRSSSCADCAYEEGATAMKGHADE